MINEFTFHNFTESALSDRAHMHLEGHVSDLIAILAWAAKHDIPFLEALAGYVPTNRKWGALVSYAQMGKMEEAAENPEKSQFLNLNRNIGRTPWQKFMDKLKDGQPLSSALSALKAVPAYIKEAIKEAEAKGNLKTVLPLLAERLHDSESSAGKWKMMMLYPLTQIFTISFIITGLMVFIVPNFAMIFYDLLGGEPLPEVTQMVINASFFLKENFIYIVAVITVLFSLFTVLSSYGLFSNFLFYLPFVGTRVKQFVLYDVARSMSCFMTTGNDILYSAEATMHCQKCIPAKIMLKRFTADLRTGTNWLDAWERHIKLGSPIHFWMLRNAAARDKVAEGFVHLQNYLGEEIHFFSGKIMVVLEFFITLGSAVIVGSVILALFMPLAKIITSLSW
jgi:type IV pilus assembly protein PilC